MKRKLTFVLGLIIASLTGSMFAQGFSADKTYAISNRNDANIFMQDNGTGKVDLGAFNDNSYWKLIATANDNCYYVQNAVTEKYMQSTASSEVEVETGDTPVEISIILCAEEGDGMYGMASTDQNTYNFTSGTIGANWRNNNVVQGFAAVSGTNHRSFWKIEERAIPQATPLIPTDWTAPPVPGKNPTTIAGDAIVYVYNIQADAIMARGLNWLTMATTDRPENGDNAEPAARQKIKVQQSGSNIKLKFNDRGDNTNFGQANNTDPGQMWTDLSNAGDRVVFTPAASENYPNAFTLTNVQHNQKVDVLWGRGGKLTLWNGKGYHDWAFLSAEDFTSGKLSQFKARKAIWELYKALEKANALNDVTDALASAKAVYTSSEATTEELRAAFRTLFLAVANKIEDPVDVSYAFTHADFAGDRSAEGWSYTDFAINAGECEKYHATFESNQTATDMPNGLYDVTFTGIFRQDDGQTQDNPQLIVNETTANFPNMNDLVGQWNVGGDANNDWANSGSAKRPNQMWSAADAQALDAAAATVEGIKVKNNTLDITFKVTGANQWFNFQRVFITYKGAVTLGLYKSLIAKISEAGDFVTANTNTIVQSYLDAITNSINAASELTVNSEEEALSTALENLNNALNKAKSAPSVENYNILNSTITYAEADGVPADQLNAARTALNTGTANEVKDALDALRLARRVKNAETHANVFAGQTPAAGDFYLYNVGQQRFFCGGDDWGAHAAIGFPGIILTLEATATEDEYKLDTHLKNGDDNGNPREYLNYGGYCDTWTGDAWKFIKVSDGVYNIVRTSDNNLLLGYSTNTYNRLDTDKNGGDNANNQWKLVTKAERDALIANASKENPVDVSYLIASPNFSQREDVSKWTFEGGAEIWGRGSNHPDFAIEAYNKNSCRIAQTVEGLAPGTYELSVQAFYRDGNFGKQEETLNGGGEALQLATLFAGAKSALICNVSAGADKAPGMGRSSKVGFMPDGIDDACLYFQSGLYWAKLEEIVVGEDGKMTIGAEKNEKRNDGDWLVLDNFRLRYLGAGVDLSGVLADLQAKIDEATALNTEGIAFLTNAISEATAALEATEAETIVNATTALTDVINVYKGISSNVKAYKQTAALATAEGISTETQDAAVNAITKDNANEVLSNALNELRTARKLNAMRMPDIYTGSAPAEGKVYLFNVGTGTFLGMGSDWSTHAAVDQVGIEVELKADGENFTMHTPYGSFNNSPYVDTPANTKYSFTAVEGMTNVYIISEAGTSKLLGWNPEGHTDGKKYWSSISNVEGAAATDANYQWKVITAEERAQLIADASEEKPVDVSFLINNASLFRKSGYDMWEKQCNGGNGGARVSTITDGNNDRAADYAWEYFEPNSFSFTQQLQNLAPGKYQVSVQGFFRDGNGDHQAQVVNEDGELKQLAYLIANDQKAFLPNIASTLDKVPGISDLRATDKGEFPNMPQSAIEYFETGFYKTVIAEVIVDIDSLLTIGIKKDTKELDGDWVVFDNFRLTYLGTTPLIIAKVDLSALIATAKALDTKNKSAESIATLTDAISAAETALASKEATIDSLTTAKTNLQNAIDGLVEDPAFTAAKDSLAALIATAKALDTKNKSAESIATLTDAISAAETALAAEDATIDSLTTAKTNLQAAIDGLVEDPAFTTAKSDLAALIATAKAIDTTGKTSESATALSNAITDAETALAADNATVESLNAAKTALQNAIDGLKDEVVDGINAIEAAAKAGKVYNTQGQKVNKTQKGVYIINGKKTVVK